MIRAAVIGTGFVGAQHVEALRRLGDVEVATVAASTDARGAEAARRLHVPQGRGDYRRILDDPSIDVVHVCTPNVHHAEMATAALEAGKHVVCEKPLAMDAAEAGPLVALAESSDRLSVLCHNYRFYPMAAELRSLVHDGALGEPHLVRGTYLQDWLLLPTDYNWRVDPATGGASRAIADIGTHWVDLAETVTSRVLEAVLAETLTLHPRRLAADAKTFEQADTGADEGVPSGPVTVGELGRASESADRWRDVHTEDQATMLLRFSGDLRGITTISQVAAGHKNALEISVDGASGSATWRQERPDVLAVGRRDGANELLTRSPNAGSAAERALAHLPGGHNEGWADGFRNLLGAAYSVIRGDATPDEMPVPLPTFRDGRRHLLFVEAALRSAAEQGWVSVSSVAHEPAMAGAAGPAAGQTSR